MKKTPFFLIILCLICGCSSKNTTKNISTQKITNNESYSLNKPTNVEYFSNFITENNKTQIILTFNLVDNADGYIIKRGNNEIRTTYNKIAIDSILEFGKQEITLESFKVIDDAEYRSEKIRLEILYKNISKQLLYNLLDNNTYEISCINYSDNDVSGLVILPDFIDEKRVSKLSDNCFLRKDYTGRDIIENDLTQEIHMPKYLEIIGKRCFESCISIKNIELPNTVKSISDYAFSHCKSLVKINIPFGVEYINCFMGCKSLESIELPSSVVELGGSAFFGCTNLKKINLDNVLNIGELSLHDTYWLDNQTGFVIIADTLYRFNGEPTTKELRIEDYPSNFKYVSPRLFDGKSSVEYIEIPGYIENIPQQTFNLKEWDELKTIILNNGVTTLQGSAFYNLKSLESVVIPNTIKTIRNAFKQGTRYKHKITLYYEGTFNEWELIDIDSRVYEGDIEVYYYSEEEPETQGNYWHYENNEIVKW